MKKISQKTRDGLILKKSKGNKSDLPPVGQTIMNKKKDNTIMNQK